MIRPPPSVAWRSVASIVAGLAAVLVTPDARAQGTTEVRLAPSPKGVLGAWLAAGPFRAGRPALETAPAGVDERSLHPSAGQVASLGRDLGGKRRPPARWTLVSSGPAATGAAQDPGIDGSRTVDLKASLEDAQGSDLVAYAGGILHVERAGRYFLMLGVDDGVRVSIDGRVVLSRDAARPLRDDDDVIALDLAAGDHEVLLKLHQRDGAWVFRAKLVDASLARPSGLYLSLPGTTADDARSLAQRMSWLIVDRAFDPLATPPRYRPVLTVRYPEGAPRGVPVPVTTTLAGPDPSVPILFGLSAGGVAVTADGAKDLVVALPAVDPWSGGSATLETTIAGRVVRSTFAARPQSEQALVRVARALSRLDGEERWVLPGSLDSVRHLATRLSRYVARGDADADTQIEEARELDRLAANLERAVDPYDGRSGMMRRALVTPLDGSASEFGLYVPPSYRPGDRRKYPLVIGLHGMDSYPLSMMRALFGLDDDKKDSAWKDRHPVPLPAVDAFVITPYAHGNTMYRDIGEDDVLYLLHWAAKVFPIDETRVTVTGPSMGGTGSASLPFHFPHVFAAAAPLCGYHDYFIRGDIGGRAMRPWERVLLQERSNVYWADNGEHLPLWVVHGTRDLPEANSGVLIDRYEKLHYPIKHDHPDVGHNVWGPTYGDLKGMKWLLSQRVDLHPSHVRFRTMRTRYGTSAWVTVDELASPSGWADIDARIKNRGAIMARSSGASALTFARDERLLEPHGAVAVEIDGTTLVFDEGETISLHRTGRAWEKGRAVYPSPHKGGHIAGAFWDIFHEPILFVYAADDPRSPAETNEGRANERVAHGFAERPGIPASYPIITDLEFIAKKEPLANDRALFLVGRTNKVLALLEAEGGAFPIRVEPGAVFVGKERITGRELGAAFVHPNPVRPDRYVAVVAGADVSGTLRALSLPELVPDFVVWDEALAPARRRILLGAAALRAGGVFENDWSLPTSILDPLAKLPRPAAALEPRPSGDSSP